jgi:hypothetical protein
MQWDYYQILLNDGREGKERVGSVWRMSRDGATSERWDWKKKAWVNDDNDTLARSLVEGLDDLERLKDEAAAKKAITDRNA